MTRTTLRTGLVLAAIAAGALAGQGCAERQAQTAVQTSLTAMAEGVVTIATVTRDGYPAARQQAQDDASDWCREQGLEPRQCPAGYERAREALEPWRDLREAIPILTSALRLGQAATDIWVQTGELPDQWGSFCEAIGDATSEVARLIEVCGVDVPESVMGIAEQGAMVCGIAVNFFTPAEEE
jgi:hypothetical protein